MGTGRPVIELNEDEFEKLCHIQCTKYEIAEWFNIDEDTIDAWCKRVYGTPFSGVHKRLSSKGKSSLRRHMFKLAQEGNVAACIFLAKNLLGMRDRFEVDQTITQHTVITVEAKQKVIEDVKSVLETIGECKQVTESPSTLLRLPSLRSQSPNS